jgi:predicted transcriptional regulator
MTPTIDDKQSFNINTISGLELAKHVLFRLVHDHDSIEGIAENFNNDKQLISDVVRFLNDIRWIKQDVNGIYKITTKGKNNMISRQKPLVNLGR